MAEIRCVICGELIPEGRMVCPQCENSIMCTNQANNCVIIKLDTIIDILKFSKIVSMCDFDVVVRSQCYVVNGKSALGMCSLNLFNPMKVEFYGNIPYEVREGMKKFIVD